MKKRIIFISLILLPIIFFIIEVVLKHSRGEFYLYDNYDGPYGFLLASLNIAQNLKPGYFQHPGIVPQIIIAVIIKISHFLQGNDPDIVMDTFNRPEFYFNRINLIFTFLTAITIYFLGKISYEKIGNIFAAIFIQFTPFMSIEVIYQITHNTTETTIVILILILIAIAISYINEIVITKKKNLTYIYYFGITCGLALASLLSILPIMVIPFLLIRSFKYKIYFVLISAVTFSILFFSISPDSSRIWMFIFSNIVHSGKYGTGSANFVDTTRIIPELQHIYDVFASFVVVYILIFITLLMQFIPKYKVQIRSNKYFVLLNGVIIVMSAYILLVIKQHEGYYILPGLLFSVIGIYSINSIISELFPKYFKFSQYIFLYVFFILLTFPQIKSFNKYVSFFDTRKNESYKIVKFLNENYPQIITVSSDQTASMPTAFNNALNYTGEETDEYISILNNRFPNYVYFQRWRKDFIYINYNEDLKKRLINADSLVFHSFNDKNFDDFKEKIKEFTNKPNLTFNEVFANKNGEKIYLVKLKK